MSLEAKSEESSDQPPKMQQICQAVFFGVESYHHQDQNGVNQAGIHGSLAPVRLFFGCQFCTWSTHVSVAYPDLRNISKPLAKKVENTRILSRNPLVCPEGESSKPIFTPERVGEVIKHRKTWRRDYDYSFLEPIYY